MIGAGPGDPGLITVKGRDCVAAAEVVIYDYLANPALLRLASPDAELIYAGKVGGQHNREQRQINELIVEKALEGKRVARLKGGDPFIFGRGGEECEALVAAGIPFEVVPGVTSALGAAAYAGIPLTHRDVTTSVAFVTGHEHPGKDQSEIDWDRLSLGSGTVVFYMGVRNLPSIVENLMLHGRSPETPVALVRWGSRPEQEVVTGTLRDIVERARKANIKAPAVTIVGEVVRLRETLRWFDNRPLSGKGILVTRAADQAGEFTAMLESLGAVVYECPTIRLVPAEDPAPLDSALDSLSGFDWTIFTSANAVRFFFARLALRERDARAFGSCRICAVGPRTAAVLGEFGLKADLIPADYKGEGVVESFRAEGVAGKRIFFPRADRARDVIPEGLEKLGAEVTAPVAYTNVMPFDLPEGIEEALSGGRIDCITFTSSSTVDNLARILGENRMLRLLQGVAIASIGPITSKTCTELGLPVDIEPSKFTLPELTGAIVRYFESRS